MTTPEARRIRFWASFIPWAVVAVLIAYGEYNSQQQMRRVETMVMENREWAIIVSERLNELAKDGLDKILPPHKKAKDGAGSGSKSD